MRVGLARDARCRHDGPAVSNQILSKPIKHRTARLESILMFMRRLCRALSSYFLRALPDWAGSVESPYSQLQTRFTTERKPEKALRHGLIQLFLRIVRDVGAVVRVPETPAESPDYAFWAGIGTNSSRTARPHPRLIADYAITLKYVSLHVLYVRYECCSGQCHHAQNPCELWCVWS